MRRIISSYGLLASFRAAAAHESFSRAADDLNLTHGAISRAIRQLEADLGASLFERRNRRVFLTDDGRILAEAVEVGLHRIEQAAIDIKERSSRSMVLLSCEPTLLMRWLIPRTSAFNDQYPDIDLQLAAAGGPVLLGQGIDLAIRRTDFAIPDFYDQFDLCNEEIGPVCSVAKTAIFFDKAGVKSDAPLLHTKTRPEAWSDWRRLSRGARRVRLEGPIFEHFYLSLQACIAGLGVAIGPARLVADSIAEGVLVAPLGFKADGTKYVLLASKAEERRRSVEIVQEWLINQFRVG